jgi:hypothetical protein
MPEVSPRAPAPWGLAGGFGLGNGGFPLVGDFQFGSGAPLSRALVVLMLDGVELKIEVGMHVALLGSVSTLNAG